MSAQNRLGAEDDVLFSETNTNYTTPISSFTEKHSTDEIISKYEQKLNQSISVKTLQAVKSGNLPQFTVEENAFLTKKAAMDEQESEINVITPPPIVVLKKGNTEINIKNPARMIPKKVDDSLFKEDSGGISYVKMESIKREEPQDAEMKMEIKSEVKSINKNAYEIRSDVLVMALGWIQSKRDYSMGNGFNPSDEDVLNTAQKFYKFVENRK